MDDVRLTAIEKQLKEILNLLNGRKGLVTTIALQEQKIKDIPSPTNLKWYAFIGGGITVFFGLIGYSVVKLIGGK